MDRPRLDRGAAGPARPTGCPHCATLNRDGAKYCSDCGLLLQVACPVCGDRQSLQRSSCTACGASLSIAPVHRGGRRRFDVPVQYTPRGLAQRILSSRAAVEGERKHVTVLFADVKGSLELLAGRDPEEARQLLDPVLEVLVHAVHLYEGTVNQFMGDGIMALFGAPLAQEDHAVRACHAALRMHDGVRRLPSSPAAAPPAAIQLRVGLNSGEVIVGSVGSDLAMDYTAVGQTTQLASRLEQMAEPGSALCTAATVRLAEGHLRFEALGPREIRGRPHPVEVFRVVEPAPARMRFHARAARGLTRFVGRDHEYGDIARAVERSRAGQGQVVMLVGEAGVGKSRLLWEFTRSGILGGTLLLESGGVPYGTTTPHLPIAAMLRAYLGIADLDSRDAVGAKLAARLAALDPALGRCRPALGELLGAPVDDTQWARLTPTERRKQTHDALTQLLLAESRQRPVVLLVEDLHWLDSESLAFLEHFVDRAAASRVAVLLDTRPEAGGAWSSRVPLTRIRLEPLARDLARDLLTALVGKDPRLEPLKTALAERTGGNPFFLEECVRGLAEDGVLSGSPGAYNLARALDRVQVPASVTTVLAARIDRLAEEDKRTLQACAVIGDTVPVALLAALTAEPEESLDAALGRLRDAEFLHEASRAPEAHCAFVHALTREVVYAGLTLERRRALHRRILGAIEQTYADRLLEHAERLGYHAMHGELWGSAVGYCRQAATKATNRSAYRAAAAFHEQVLTAFRHLPRSPAVLEQTVDVRLELRSALLPAGEIERDLENLRLAETCARELPGSSALALVSTYLARDLSILGHSDEAIETGRRALALAEETDDAELRALTGAYLGALLLAKGEYREAADRVRHGVGRLGAGAQQRFALPVPAPVFFRLWLVSALTHLGDFDEAVLVVEAGLRHAAEIEQPLASILARHAAGFLAVHRGQIAGGIDDLERALALSDAWDLRSWLPNIASILGCAYARAGRPRDGIRAIQRAIESSAAAGDMVNHASYIAGLAEAHRLAGDIDHAGRHALHALDLARKHKERGNEAVALRVLADVRIGQSPPDFAEADDLSSRALAIAADLGMRPLQALCHWTRAALHEGTGAWERARAGRTRCRALADEMGMAIDVFCS